MPKKKDPDPDAAKVSFRLSGQDVRRTRGLIVANAPALASELIDNQSVLWRLIYRAGLDYLEEDPSRILMRRSREEEDPTPPIEETKVDLTSDPEADERRKARGQARKAKR